MVLVSGRHTELDQPLRKEDSLYPFPLLGRGLDPSRLTVFKSVNSPPLPFHLPVWYIPVPFPARAKNIIFCHINFLHGRSLFYVVYKKITPVYKS